MESIGLEHDIDDLPDGISSDGESYGDRPESFNEGSFNDFNSDSEPEGGTRFNSFSTDSDVEGDWASNASTRAGDDVDSFDYDADELNTTLREIYGDSNHMVFTGEPGGRLYFPRIEHAKAVIRQRRGIPEPGSAERRQREEERAAFRRFLSRGDDLDEILRGMGIANVAADAITEKQVYEICRQFFDGPMSFMCDDDGVLYHPKVDRVKSLLRERSTERRTRKYERRLRAPMLWGRDPDPDPPRTLRPLPRREAFRGYRLEGTPPIAGQSFFH